MNKEHVVIMVGAGEFPEHLPMAQKLKKHSLIVCETNNDLDSFRPKPNVNYTVVGSISSLCVARAVKKCLQVGVDRVTVPLNKLDGYKDESMLKKNADNLALGLHCQGVDIEDNRILVKPSSVWKKSVESLKSS